MAEAQEQAEAEAGLDDGKRDRLAAAKVLAERELRRLLTPMILLVFWKLEVCELG